MRFWGLGVRRAMTVKTRSAKGWLLLAVLAALVGCQHQPPEYVSTYTSPPAAPPVAAVSIIGDSYTGGSQMGGNGPQGWPILVEDQLGQRGVQIRANVAAEGGAGYVSRGTKGGVFDEQVPKVVGPNSRLVIFLGSRNDDSAPPADLSVAVQKTLADVKAEAPTAKVVVIGPPWPNASPTPEILAVRDVLRAQAEAAGAIFIDPIAEGWFFDRPDLIGADGVHPTDAGHLFMADRIAPLIAQELGQTPAAP